MWPIEPDAFESFVSAPAGAETDDALYFTFIGERIVCVSEAGIPRAVTRDEFRWFDVEVSFKHYLGRWEGRSCYALVIDGTVPEGFATVGLRDWLERVDSAFFYLAGRAKQIVDWHRTHRFCGRCGSATRDHRVDRAKECPRCGLLNYPRLSPSIIVLVRKGDEMLLARNARWRHGTYSTIAGFVEPGESIEQAVHREVFEEVGLAVSRLRYMGSQPWPFPNSLMLGFHADYAGGDIVCQEEEIDEARWFHYAERPSTPTPKAISAWLIDAFVRERSEANGRPDQ